MSRQDHAIRRYRDTVKRARKHRPENFLAEPPPLRSPTLPRDMTPLPEQVCLSGLCRTSFQAKLRQARENLLRPKDMQGLASVQGRVQDDHSADRDRAEVGRDSIFSVLLY
jgi:hypothetical protein